MGRRSVPPDLAAALNEAAELLRLGVPPAAILCPGDVDVPFDLWLADLLQRLASGATAKQALGIATGRRRRSDDELRRIYFAFLKARIDGSKYADALGAVPGMEARNVSRAIREARARGLVSNIPTATLRTLQKQVKK